MDEKKFLPNISPIDPTNMDDDAIEDKIADIVKLTPEKAKESDTNNEEVKNIIKKVKKPHGNIGRKNCTKKATEARLKKLKENKIKIANYDNLMKNGIPVSNEIDYDLLADKMAERYYLNKQKRKALVKESIKTKPIEIPKNTVPKRKTKPKPKPKPKPKTKPEEKINKVISSKKKENIIYPDW